MKYEGIDRTKTKPTPKQNKYKNHSYSDKIATYLSKGMNRLTAEIIVRKRVRGKK